ncbi:MAG: RluA family pseudouridine synthase [Candidatus Colwellbacteria bacterium]|nr:RluA family pseudouridine synthase [Candidatus Colwellbacteria bacterium]
MTERDDLERAIIYEDENLLAINKPAGLLVHRGQNTGEETLVDQLLIEFPELAGVGDSPSSKLERPGIVHRLDKDTSGVILIARNQSYFDYLKNLFRDRRIKKTYRAVVLGLFKEKVGVINAPIGIKAGSTKRTTHAGKNIKAAVTRYRILKELGGFSYIEAYPETGRTHQIRVHFNAIGHPIAGDKLYGGKLAVRAAERQMLHAYSLEFPIAPGKNMVITADLPEDFVSLLNSLEK